MAAVPARLDVRTADGLMDAHLHAPPASAGSTATYPVVIMYHDAFGVRPAMHAMAQRLASHGYLVVLPNLLYRSGAFAPFNMKTVWTDAKERERLMAIAKRADGPSVVRDTEALLDALASHPLAADRAKCIGSFGYCLGGRLAIYLASAIPSRVVAAASFHGGNFVTDDADSLHRRVGQIAAHLYFGIAENDRTCTAEHQAALREALDRAKVSYEMETYRAAHGFAVDDATEYSKAAAEQHWERLVALMKKLRPSTQPHK